MPARSFTSALALAAFLLTTSAALADKKVDYAAAKKHYTAAEAALAAEKFAAAATEYQAAYDITKDPILFFKLGQAHQGAGGCDQAIGFYQRYLKEGKPTKEFADQTASEIEACELAGAGAPPSAVVAGSAGTDGEGPDGGSDGSEATGDDSPAPETDDAPAAEVDVEEQAPSFVDEEGSWQRTAAWTSVGLAAAFATAGAVLGLSAQSREEDLKNLLAFRDADGEPARYDGNTQERYDELVDEGERFETLSLVAFGVAGAAAVTAAVFFTLDLVGDDEADKTATIAPAAGVDSLGVHAAWRF